MGGRVLDSVAALALGHVLLFSLFAAMGESVLSNQDGSRKQDIRAISNQSFMSIFQIYLADLSNRFLASPRSVQEARLQNLK